MGIIPSSVLFRIKDILLIFNIQNNYFSRKHKGDKTTPTTKDIQSNIFWIIYVSKTFQVDCPLLNGFN